MPVIQVHEDMSQNFQATYLAYEIPESPSGVECTNSETPGLVRRGKGHRVDERMLNGGQKLHDGQ